MAGFGPGPSVLVSLSVALVTALMLGAAVAVFVLARRPQFRHLPVWAAQLRARSRPLGVLGAVVAFKMLAAGVLTSASWLVGWNVTGLIYDVEADAVLAVQAFATPPLTAYFTFVYVYAFTFLLSFPVVAYLTHPDPRPLRETVVAYSLNYLLGLAAYVVFIAYGPRNYIPDRVSSLLYVYWPESYLLTSSMNANTNVFPSLHVSFAVTVALLAWRTREGIPWWWPVAAVLAASVAASTLYLGIHWITDVVAGTLLALACVWIAARDPLERLDPVLDRTVDRARAFASR
jgi:membrane-associated phospholipid phosphatase